MLLRIHINKVKKKKKVFNRRGGNRPDTRHYDGPSQRASGEVEIHHAVRSSSIKKKKKVVMIISALHSLSFYN